MRGSRLPRTAIQAAEGARPERQAQHQVRPARDALHVAVAEQARPARAATGTSVSRFSSAAASTEDERHRAGESQHKLPREQAGGNGARAGAGIGGVEIGIGPAIEGHGARARRHHGHQDPAQGAPAGQPVAASSIAVSAKGSAKIECSHLIISSVVRVFAGKPIACNSIIQCNGAHCARTDYKGSANCGQQVSRNSTYGENTEWREVAVSRTRAFSTHSASSIVLPAAARCRPLSL